MRRFLGMALWMIGCGVCLTPAVSFWQSRDSNYNVSVSSGGFTPSCAQSSTFLTAATGVTLTADKTNYDTLICGLVSDGVWNFDVLYIWAAPSATNAALINLANPGTFNGTTNGTVSFSAYNGYTGDGSTFGIETGFNPSTASSPNFVRNSANLGVYILNARTTGNPFVIGNSAATFGYTFRPYDAGSNAASINTANPFGNAVSSTQGAWNIVQDASTSENTYLNSNETAQANDNQTSTAPLNATVAFFGLNAVGGAATTDQMAAGWIGKGLSNVNSCKVNNRINTYMASLSVPKNVYSNSAC